MATEIASDNFNRADNSSAGMNLGSNWTGSLPQSDVGISSNQAYQTANTDDNAVFWNANTFHTDQYSQATLSTYGDSYGGALVRATSTDYVLGQGNRGASQMDIYWYNGGSYTHIGSSYSGDFTSGDVIRMEADGPTFTLYQNGVARIIGTDASAPKSGRPGLGFDLDSDRVDNWSGGNLYDNGIIAYASAEETPSSGTIDVSLTIPTGYTNLVLVVATRIRDATDADRNITGITWNTSEALTQAKEKNNDTYDITSEQWYRVNPTTGTNTVSVTTAGVVSVSRVTAICLAGTAQTGLPDASNGAAAATGQPTVDVTTVLNNCIVIDSLYTKDAVSPAAGTGQLPLDSTTVNGGGDGAAVSYERKATAGAVTMSWTQNLTTEQWITTAVSYPVYTAPATTVRLLSLLGIGS